MDKQQKQIEEMAKDLREAWTAWSESTDDSNAYDFVAKILAKKWQHKISENTVVLTREKYDEFLRQNFIIDMLKDCIKDASKETAEKIMKDISSDILVINTKEYGNIEVVPVERLQEIIQTLEVNE